MREHIVIPVFSSIWWFGIAFCLILMTLAIRFFYNNDEADKDKFAWYIGIALLIQSVITYAYLIFIEQSWSVIDSLPLHLCGLSFIISGLAFVTKKQILYEWTVYLGFPGGLHSVLTPEFTQGLSTWMIYDYYFAHTMLMLSPILLTMFGMAPTRWGAAKTFLYVNILMVFVFAINTAIGSNYMYLNVRPIVENPFLIGEWPWYILGFEVAGILHIAIMDLFFRIRPFRSQAFQRVMLRVRN